MVMAPVVTYIRNGVILGNRIIKKVVVLGCKYW